MSPPPPPPPGGAHVRTGRRRTTRACVCTCRYLCVQTVYQLINSADSLTVNMALTVRKVVSLLASVLAFNNTFTVYHTVGAVMVFGGALLFSAVTQKPKDKSD